jgi:hypothetical protein
VDGVDLGAVQVAVVLAVLQEAARLHVRLHLLPRGEVVRVAVQLVVTGTPRRDWTRRGGFLGLAFSFFYGDYIPYSHRTF